MVNFQGKTKSVIYIVDDDPLVREAMTLVLEQERMTVMAFESAELFLASDFRLCRGCLIVDMNMPGMDGIQLQEILVNEAVPLPVVILTGYGDIPMSVKAMKSGVDDFLIKPVSREKLLASVQAALLRGEQMLVKAKQYQDAKMRIAKLTKREREVMLLMVRCLSNKDIARHLNVSYRTVEKHKKNVLIKTGANNLFDLLNLIQECGLTSREGEV